MKNRRRGRILGLKMLYARDVRPEDNTEDFFPLLKLSSADSDEMIAYAELLVGYVISHNDRIDELIQEHTQNWNIRRLSTIDRNILRLAIAELLGSEAMPYKVIVDEAVEIAKIYSTPDSGKFVNGVIDAIYKHLFPLKP